MWYKTLILLEFSSRDWPRVTHYQIPHHHHFQFADIFKSLQVVWLPCLPVLEQWLDNSESNQVQWKLQVSFVGLWIRECWKIQSDVLQSRPRKKVKVKELCAAFYFWGCVINGWEDDVGGIMEKLVKDHGNNIWTNTFGICVSEFAVAVKKGNSVDIFEGGNPVDILVDIHWCQVQILENNGLKKRSI